MFWNLFPAAKYKWRLYTGNHKNNIKKRVDDIIPLEYIWFDIFEYLNRLQHASPHLFFLIQLDDYNSGAILKLNWNWIVASTGLMIIWFPQMDFFRHPVYFGLRSLSNNLFHTLHLMLLIIVRYLFLCFCKSIFPSDLIPATCQAPNKGNNPTVQQKIVHKGPSIRSSNVSSKQIMGA